MGKKMQREKFGIIFMYTKLNLHTNTLAYWQQTKTKKNEIYSQRIHIFHWLFRFCKKKKKQIIFNAMKLQEYIDQNVLQKKKLHCKLIKIKITLGFKQTNKKLLKKVYSLFGMKLST